jgi:hypothetical protein
MKKACNIKAQNLTTCNQHVLINIEFKRNCKLYKSEKPESASSSHDEDEDDVIEATRLKMQDEKHLRRSKV